jgi:hypothetical protein
METPSERPRLSDLGGGRNSRLGDLSATTWISGSCQTTDTTGKTQLSLCLSFAFKHFILAICIFACYASYHALPCLE